MYEVYSNRQSGKIIHRPFRREYSKLTPVQSVENGVLVSRCVFKEFDVADLYPDLHSSDYSLGNLIAVGAYGSLSYVSLSDYHNMNFVDSVTEFLNSDVSKIEN